MAMLVAGRVQAYAIARAYCLQHHDLDLDELVPYAVRARLVPEVPFLLTKDSKPLSLASKFLRMRALGQIKEISSEVLRPASTHYYGRDLAYFLSTVRDEFPDTLLTYREETKREFRKVLDSNGDSRSTNDRRYLTARQFLLFTAIEANDDTVKFRVTERRFRRTVTNHSGKKLTIEIDHSAFGRRRNPSDLFMLTAEQLATYFSAFSDYTLRVAVKLIFASGSRRAPLEFITAGQISKLNAKSVGRTQSFMVRGKAGRDYPLELEPNAIAMLQAYATSKTRMERVLKYLVRHPKNTRDVPYKQYDDDIPLFLNRFGDPLTGPAIEEACRRASECCGIKRTPHELRHECAMHFLVNKYRAIARQLTASGFKDWIARLLLESADLVMMTLQRLLGHTDPAATKKYLRMVVTMADSIRSSWCDHLQNFLDEPRHG